MWKTKIFMLLIFFVKSGFTNFVDLILGPTGHFSLDNQTKMHSIIIFGQDQCDDNTQWLLSLSTTMFKSAQFLMETYHEIDDCDSSNLYIIVTAARNSSVTIKLMSNIFTKCKSSALVLENTEANLQALQQAGVPFDSRVHLGQTDQVNGTEVLTISEVYQTQKSGQLVINPLPSNEFLTETKQSWLSRRWDRLNGTAWKVGYFPFASMLLFDSDTSEPYGFNLEVWRNIEQRLNITSELVRADSFGKRGDNGQWSGLVGMLQRGEIDVSLSSMSQTYARSMVVDFLHPVSEFDYILATHARVDVAGKVLNVFNMNTRIFIYSLICLVTIMTLLVHFFVNRSNRPDWVELVLEIHGAFMNQGVEPDHFAKLSSRIVLFSQCLLSFMTFSVFTGTLMSTLAVRGTIPIISTLEDVYELGYNLYLNGGGSTENAFRNAPEGTIRNLIWESQVGKDPKFYPNTDEGKLQGLNDDPTGVLLTSHPKFQQLLSQDQRACGAIVKTIEKRKFAMAVTKGFWFRDLLNHHIDQMQEQGIIGQLTKAHMEPMVQYTCPENEEENEFSGGGFDTVGSFFLLVAAAAALSSALALAERVRNGILVEKYWARRRKY